MFNVKQSSAIDEATLQSLQEQFRADPKNRLAQDAVTRHPVHEVALNHERAISFDHTFSNQLPTHKVTAQERSGRCWMFAGLNLLRTQAMKQLNVEEFELSQSYVMFWDKLEKANFFLESILSTLDEDLYGRLVMFLLDHPVQDGGQWDMFANLIKKYGVVPKSVMPETESSSNSNLMNLLITSKLREQASELRQMHTTGASPETLRERKQAMLQVIYRMLAVHLGEPPRSFEWQWRDKQDLFHRDAPITPQEFFQRYVQFNLDDWVCLINCPTSDKPFNKLYTIDYLGNVVEGQIVRYLNVDLPTFKQATLNALVQSDQPIWFGCDVGKRLERDLGIMDPLLYDYSLVYGTDFAANKAQRVDYGDSMMTHAMVFTGVDLDENGSPRKWRVENSWGDKYGDHGYYIMSDAWFDEFMYEVAVPKSFVPEGLLPILETEPVHLPPWDPMGALAAAS